MNEECKKYNYYISGPTTPLRHPTDYILLHSKIRYFRRHLKLSFSLDHLGCRILGILLVWTRYHILQP